MTDPADLIVIGAGPAGLAAASLASKHNLSVLLLDEQAAPGGQIYRNIEHNITHESETCAILGAEYAYGAALAETCRASDVTYTPGATVWRIDPDGSVAYSVNGAAHTAKGRRIILATGALERPVPIPGWTLPGVMTAGAAQTLLSWHGRRAPVLIVGMNSLTGVPGSEPLSNGKSAGTLTGQRFFQRYQ